MNTKKKKARPSEDSPVQKKWEHDHPVLAIFLKMSLLTLVLFLAIWYSEAKGYFNPDFTNNHTVRKWNAYYDFTEKQEVDILLVGNSHLYTGINPQNLSTALGCNAFILASPGTLLDDHYYAVKEAIKVNKPKLLVVETYGLKALTAKTEGGLSDQLKSFAARKDIAGKLRSTPYLFSPDSYPYAWSNTLRNHDFLYKNYDQIEKNIRNKNQAYKTDKKLYLGRYVRFQTGISDSIIRKYEVSGAPVDGEQFSTNDLQKEYTRCLIDLCKENEIELVFLTLPMYEKHIANYSSWKAKLGETFGETFASPEYWLDLQKEGYSGFSRNSFEDTYAGNQHMTYGGSLLATYKLVDFIQQRTRISLPDRRQDSDWRHLFNEAEGFVENNTPEQGDQVNTLLYQGKGNDLIREIVVKKSEKTHTIVMKTRPESAEQYEKLKTAEFQLNFNIKDGTGAIKSTQLNVPYDAYHGSRKQVIFSAAIIPIEIVQLTSAQIIYR